VRCPSKVKVGPHKYTISKDKGDDGDSKFMGTTNNNLLKITVRLELDGEKVPESQVTETFLHEILHVIDLLYDLDLKENQIGALAVGILTTIRDNKLDFLDKNTYTS
jgi:hypothetical protein